VLLLSFRVSGALVCLVPPSVQVSTVSVSTRVRDADGAGAPFEYDMTPVLLFIFLFFRVCSHVSNILSIL
jgi:hypothetical protein